MTVTRNIFWFIAGFLVSLVAGLAFRSDPASAQTSVTATQVTPPPARRNEPPRRTAQPAPSDDEDTPTAQPIIIRTGEDGQPLASDRATESSEDGDDPARVQARRNMDGEPSIGQERPGEEDGVPLTGEPEPLVKDGEADTLRDPRLRSDIDAFEKPAAGYDAVAFQIDDLNPLLDRRPQRLARFEPYDPIGLKSGTWIIFPEIEFGLGATSNIRRSPAAERSAVFDVRPTVRAVTNWRVHAIELKATGFATAFPGFASENDRAYALEARGRLDFSKRSNLEVLASHQRDQEGRQARDALDSAAERASILTTRAAVALNHRFNRLSVQLRGAVTDVNYEPVTTVSGSLVANDQRDYTQRDAGARATWAFKPTLSAFTDVSVNDRRYRAAPGDGITRDSTGYRAVAGISFGNTGRLWRGEVSAGYGEQRPDDARLTATGGFILDANLGWRPTELTSFLLSARTDFNDSTTPGQSGALVRTVGLEARHAFQRQLIGTAALRHSVTDYRGVALTERETTAELGAEYALNRSTTLFSRYSHVMFGSSAPAADYTVDTIRFGVRVRQ